MTKSCKYVLIILLTPLYFLLATWCSVLPHEFSHTTAAWYFGFKSNPFAIQYGHITWQNIFFLSDLEDTVNYYLINLLDHPKLAGFIAFAGPGIGTVSVYLISLVLLNWQKVVNNFYLYYFAFWLNLINLSEFVAYVYLRSFIVHADLGRVESFWGISPWWIFLGGGSLVAIALFYFFTQTLINAYVQLQLNALVAKIIFLILCLFMIFGHSGIRMFLGYHDRVTIILSILSCLMVPVLLIYCWPSRSWVEKRIALKNQSILSLLS